MKELPLQELRQFGFLQEANRVFFHPLGLALTIETDEDTGKSRLFVQDAREDPEGFVFPPELIDTDEARFKARRVQDLWVSRMDARMKLLGNMIQDVPDL